MRHIAHPCGGAQAERSGRGGFTGAYAVIVETFVVDSFTDAAFAGNPAGVVLLDAPAAEAWMLSVAAELKHAETAFVVTGGSERPRPLRWFTPTTEVDLCGHATLAAAHVLGGDQRFDTRSGELACRATGDGRVEMDFPTIRSTPTGTPAELATALPGVTVEHVAEGDFDLIVQVGSADQVRALRPDPDVLGRLPVRAVIVTAPGDRDGVDFVSRVFAPAVGIPEDPVTGSAHCALAPWWAPQLNRTDLVGEQASPRGGIVHTSLRDDRVAISGNAVTVLRGDLVV